MRRHPNPQDLIALVAALACGAPAAWAVDAFQEAAGQVVMEAEKYDARIPRTSRNWEVKTSVSGYSGTGYLQGLPNTGGVFTANVLTTSPEVSYNVTFSTPGTYYVWGRGSAANTGDDSLHVGLDGTLSTSADNLYGYSAAWTWRRTGDGGTPITLVIAQPGVHTIHLWVREDGIRFDKFLLRTSSSSTAPSGTGPAESPRVSVGADTTPPVVTITSPLDGAVITP